jgi:hypothetical protein
MLNLQHSALLAPAGYVNTFPLSKPEHLKIQRCFFGTARTAGLSDNKEQQLDGINALLGLAITSRTQLSPKAYEVLVSAIEAGAFTHNWELTGRVRAEVEIYLVGAPTCASCQERPIHYLFADENGHFETGENEGLCRECARVQVPSDEEVLAESDSIPAAQSVVDALHAEWELIRQRQEEDEAAREAALQPLREQAEKLRSAIRAYGYVLNDKGAFHSPYTRRKLRHLYFTAQGELRRFENEYPFI